MDAIRLRVLPIYPHKVTMQPVALMAEAPLRRIHIPLLITLWWSISVRSLHIAHTQSILFPKITCTAFDTSLKLLPGRRAWTNDFHNSKSLSVSFWLSTSLDTSSSRDFPKWTLGTPTNYNLLLLVDLFDENLFEALETKFILLILKY